MQTDGNELKKKRFINVLWIVLLVAGLLLIPFSIVISSAFTPEINMPLFFILLLCGELMLILALAAWRVAKGKAKSNNILRALTPPQIVLAVSLLLLNAGLLSVHTAMLFVFGMIGIHVAIIMAIVRGVVNLKIKQSNQQEYAQNTIAPLSNSQSVRSVRETAPAAAVPAPAASAANSVKPYTPSSVSKTGTWPIVSPLVRPLPEQRKLPPKPAIIHCETCGIELKNDGSVSHLGDRYFCERCYEDLLVRYYEKTGETRKSQIILLIRKLNKLANYKRRKSLEKKLITALSNLEYYRKLREKERYTRCECCGRELSNDELIILNDMMLCRECIEELKKC